MKTWGVECGNRGKGKTESESKHKKVTDIYLLSVDCVVRKVLNIQFGFGCE
jgi:hypothetical protein